MELLAWTGSILLACCGLPELLATIKNGRCSLSWGFLLMWLFGEIFTLVPVFSNKLGAFLLFNYSLNTVVILILVWFKLRGKT